MALQGYHLFLLLVLVGSLAQIKSATQSNLTASLNRHSFPPDFVFGTASSAYQYEGGAREGGKGPSIWDIFTHKYPGKIADGSNGDVAINSYNHYREDVAIVREMNLNAYRFSISWSRILPNGKVSGGVNKEGIKYYNNLIYRLQADGIKPVVTLFHWDLPQALEDEYGGFLGPKIVDDFRNYADICFKEFGDRVKQWITLNDPWSYSTGGYATGMLAPGRCSTWQKLKCREGHSGIEPYLAGHHLLLAHAAAVNLYRLKYQVIYANTAWNHRDHPPVKLVCTISNETQDRKAAQRARDFMFGWFMNPITTGHYPQSMRSLVAHRLPKFFKAQSDMVKGSFDFIGLNYYTTNYAADSPKLNAASRTSYLTDSHVNFSRAKPFVVAAERDGIPIGSQTAGSSRLYVYPRGLRDLLLYTKRKYNNPLTYITENGIYEVNNGTFSPEKVLADNYRIDYHLQHLASLQSAIKAGANVKGYFARSLLDAFEWSYGYTARYGFFSVDYKNEFKRHPKLSARWFRKFLKT